MNRICPDCRNQMEFVGSEKDWLNNKKIVRFTNWKCNNCGRYWTLDRFKNIWR